MNAFSRRLGLLFGVVLVLALGAGLLVQALGTRQSLQAQLDDRGREIAAVMAAAMAQQNRSPQAWEAVAAAQFKAGQTASLRLRSDDGTLLVNLAQPEPQGRSPAWFKTLLPLQPATATAVVEGREGQRAELHVVATAAWAHDALWASCLRAGTWMLALAALAAVLAAWSARAWLGALGATMAQAQALVQGRFVEAGAPPLAALDGLTDSMNATVRHLRAVSAGQAEQVALLQRQAQMDAVTGVPLRRHFVGLLQQRLAQPGSPGIALLLVRVVHLEALNQRLGHEATDRLLGAVADVLMTYVDRVDGTFAGRLNGCDFALCLPVPGVAKETAESLRAALAAAPALRLGAAEVVVAGTDGVCNTSAGAALASADAALARAEAGADEGAGLVVEQHALSASAVAGERAWREQLSSALAEGRVRLAEQMVLNPQGRLLQLECALRVQLSPGGDHQAAERWLALARRSRLMPQMDLRALDLVLLAIAADGRARAVQVSPVSLATPGFVAEVAARLAASPGAAHLLSIECVEALRPVLGATLLAAAASAWRPWGVRLGAVHAGGPAQQLPELQAAGVDYIKLDARHLRGVATDADVRGYALGLVSLIHDLGMTVLAAGVDDAPDLVALWALGFDGAHGPGLVATEAAP